MSQVPATSATTTALAISDPQAMSSLKEALGLEAFSPYNLPHIAVPRESTQFTVQTEEGEKYVPELCGVIIESKIIRSYWEKDYTGTGARPDCESDDGIRGVGTPGGECLNCPFNQYGTDNGGAGKACREHRVLFVLLDDQMIPSVISLPPTSIKEYQSYLMTLLTRANSAFKVRTSFRLERITTKSGQKIIQVKFRSVQKLSDEDIAAVRAYKEAMAPLISQYRAIEDRKVDVPNAMDAEAVPVADGDIVRDAANSPF